MADDTTLLALVGTLITLTDLAAECGVSKVSVHHWTKRGRLPRTAAGRKAREVLTALAVGDAPAPVERKRPGPAAQPPRPPTISGLPDVGAVGEAFSDYVKRLPPASQLKALRLHAETELKRAGAKMAEQRQRAEEGALIDVARVADAVRLCGAIERGELEAARRKLDLLLSADEDLLARVTAVLEDFATTVSERSEEALHDAFLAA